ncbi:MAG: Lrp/AsnC family transcriptional regulator [Magnetococcales bacterium]|nr:Lrp/AsnC family transcriptional regulator [Magnetococcales bacterium]
MDPFAIRIINHLQNDFPLDPHPFAVVAAHLHMDEVFLIEKLTGLLHDGYLTRFGPFFNTELMGGGLTLAAMRVPSQDFDTVATLVNAQPEIAHNYARDHELNMWFVVATEHEHEIRAVLTRLESLTGLAVFDLPKLHEFRLGFQVHLDDDGHIDTRPLPVRDITSPATAKPDAIDHAIITATQTGLPLVSEPYRVVAETIGLTTTTLLDRLQRMIARGWIRRIGAATNHYRLGLTGNGMSVWDVPDDKVAALGKLIGTLDFVTHCYIRPRHRPTWPYNLFVMVHGPDHDAVATKVSSLAEILGNDHQGYQVLHSTRILKKTGLRIQSPRKTSSCSG